MRALKVALAAALLIPLLSGCSSAAADGKFEVAPPPAPGGPYTFTAEGNADNYTWDLGDHLSTAYGKSVTHTYDFDNGAISVTLRVRSGGAVKESTQRVTLGTGVNAAPTFLLEGETNWTVPNEVVKFSAGLSSDPDHDPLRYSWSCLRTGPAKRLAPHPHENYGVDFSKAPPGSVTAGVATRPLPAPTRTYEGDLCEALGTGTPSGTDTETIAGSFKETGIYEIFLLASDPVHPTVSGQFRVYVTAPGERPSPHQTFTLSGKFTGGANGSLQSGCDTVSPGTVCDRASLSFSTSLGARAGWLNLTYDPGTPAATSIECNLVRGESQAANLKAPGSAPVQRANLKAGGYTIVATLHSGSQADFTCTVELVMDMDPYKVY